MALAKNLISSSQTFQMMESLDSLDIMMLKKPSFELCFVPIRSQHPTNRNWGLMNLIYIYIMISIRIGRKQEI